MASWIISLLPIAGVIIGWVLSTITNGCTNRQQLERERISYKRSLQDARRERLRSAYKVILNVTHDYEIEALQHDHQHNPVNVSLTSVDEAVSEIKLEDVGSDVTTIFSEMQVAFNIMYARLSMSDDGNWDRGQEQKGIVLEKAKELTAAMQKQLKALESFRTT
ncbi:MAG TPA: hypothetical protein DIU08_12595 [Ktedonobacter sp.]|nr:hypothetical protein [Ktedonobacter sp.]